MPISYRIDPENNLAFVKAKGVLKETDYIEVRSKLVKDPLFRPGMNQLADFRSVEKHELTSDGIHLFMDQEISLKPILKGCRLAIVTSSDLHFGLTRMFIVEMGETESSMQVFRDMDEAKAWLIDEAGEIEDSP